MQVNKICPVLKPRLEKIAQLYSSLFLSQLQGDYKAYRTLHKEYAEYCVKNFDLFHSINFKNRPIPLFSKEGLNIVKIVILDKFRIKTPAEKKFEQLGKIAKLKDKYNLNITI